MHLLSDKSQVARSPGVPTLLNHDKMDASLENLRYSNVQLNGMNKENAKGYCAVKRKDGTLTGKYYSAIRINKKKNSPWDIWYKTRTLEY